MSTPSSSSYLKTSHPVQLFSPIKPSPQPPVSSSSSSSSVISSMKLKSLIHTLIVSHMCRIIRALSKVKAAIVETLKGNQSNTHFYYNKKQKMSKKIIFGSFRLHYNWCSSKSSHVIPIPSRVFEGLPKASDTHLCYEFESDEQFRHDDSQLAGYLQWLEEKVHHDDGHDNGNKMNEIDMLAEMFIANCHEKFKLEKQDSDRRFNEMLARGM